MNILMFGWDFPPFVSGGLGTSCYGLTRHLALEDVKIKFVIPQVRGKMYHYFLDILDGEKVLINKVTDILKKDSFTLESDHKKSIGHLSEYIPQEILLSPYFSESDYLEALTRMKNSSTEKDYMNFNINAHGEDLISEVMRYSKVGEILGMDKDFDIIHAHDWMAGLPALEAQKVSSKPFLFHAHTTEYDRQPHAPSSSIVEIEQKIFTHADQVIAVSHRTKNTIIEKYGISESKITVVYNAIEKGDTVSFDNEMKLFQDKKVILYLGRITSQKGPEYFVDMAKEVSKKRDDVCFVMAGSGDMSQEIIEKVGNLGMSHLFHFTGFLREAEREKLCAMSNVYVMPSISEPFGLTPLEVIKYNVPVIVSKQSGVSELLTGMVQVDFWDIKKMSSLVGKLLSDSDFNKKTILSNATILDQLDWKVSAKKVISLYNQLLV